MRILYQGCIYESSDKITIDTMLNNGGTILMPPINKITEENNKQEETVKIVRTRGRRKK